MPGAGLNGTGPRVPKAPRRSRGRCAARGPVPLASQLDSTDVLAAPIYSEVMEATPNAAGSTKSVAPDAGAKGADRSEWPVWQGRVGEREPPPSVAHLTPSQRVDLCWEVSKQAWLLSGGELDESAFRRDVEVLTRRAR